MKIDNLIIPLGAIGSETREQILQEIGRHYVFDEAQVNIALQGLEDNEVAELKVYERPGILEDVYEGMRDRSQTLEGITAKIRDFAQRESAAISVSEDSSFDEVFNPAVIQPGSEIFSYNDETESVRVRTVAKVDYCSTYSVGYGQRGSEQVLKFTDGTSMRTSGKHEVFLSPEEAAKHIEKVVLPEKHKAITKMVAEFEALKGQAQSLKSGDPIILEKPKLDL